MEYNNYDRNDLIKIIVKRNDENYKSLFNHCFVMLRSIVADQQSKKNFDYDEALADFNDCVNQAEWTSELIKPQAASSKPGGWALKRQVLTNKK